MWACLIRCCDVPNAASTEDTGGAAQQPASDSSSDSDYDEQLARKIKQRSSYGNSDPDSFLSQTASVLTPTAAIASSTAALYRHGSITVSTENSKESIAKLVSRKNDVSLNSGGSRQQYASL